MQIDGVVVSREIATGSITHCALTGCRYVTVLLALLASATTAMGTEDNTARVQSAIDQYTAAMECKNRTQRLQSFERAAQLFQQVIDGDATHAGVKNAELYVNLGNAALQSERIGSAIVAYRRALELAPHDAQARQNLAYARSLLPDWIRREEGHGLFDSLFFWRSLFTPGQIQICGAACFLVAALLVAIGIWRSQAIVRNLALIPLLAWLVITISLFLEPAKSATQNVVVLDESTVYTADSENSAPRLSKPLPSGAEVRLVQSRDRWTEVQLPDGRTGWVLSSAIDCLAPAAE